MGLFGGGGSAASNMVGATSSVAGTAGLVPAPAAGDDGKILCGDATFQSPNFPTKANTVLSNRTIGQIGKGFYSSAGNMTLYNDRQYFLPIFIPSELTSWTLNFTTGGVASTTSAKVALYNYGTDTGLPKTRIAVSSSFSIQNASATEFSTSFSTSVKRGLYFITCSVSATCAFQSFNDTGLLSWVGYMGQVGTLNTRTLRYMSVTWDTSDCPTTLDTSKFSLTDESYTRLWLTYT